MGCLNLPSEVTCGILGYLDYASLGEMRLVNSQSRSLVDSLPAFRDVVELAPEVLHILAVTGVVSMFSANQVHATFMNYRCAFCPNFGPYLYVPSCSRCCDKCLEQDMRTATISASDAAELFCVPETLLRQLPVVKVIPKLYTPSTIDVSPTPDFLVNVPDVYQLSLRQHNYGLLDKSLNLVNVPDVYHLSLRQHNYGLLEKSLNHHRSDLRFMTATALPFFTRSTNKLEWGIYCKGCDGAGTDSIDDSSPFYAVLCRIKNLGWFPTAYTEEGFLEHLQVCESAKKLWNRHIEEDDGEALERTRDG
jgi:hypothetical protein